MQRDRAGPTVDELRAFAGRRVRLRLDDGSELCGRLRTELLTEKSISVFLIGDDGGATVYIHEIGSLAPA